MSKVYDCKTWWDVIDEEMARYHEFDDLRIDCEGGDCLEKSVQINMKRTIPRWRTVKQIEG